MAKLYFIIFFLIAASLSAFGQKAYKEYVIKEVKGADDNCVYLPKYSPSKRRNFYPFNDADTIKLVSFRHHEDNYPIKGNAITSDSLFEQKVLAKQEIDELTDILYNNFYKKASGIGSLTQCFAPRNAIIFIDKFGKAKETIFICFHCSRYEAMSQKYGLLGADCDQKMKMLMNFFIRQKLLFGTNRSVGSYPGETFKDDSFVAPPK